MVGKECRQLVSRFQSLLAETVKVAEICSCAVVTQGRPGRAATVPFKASGTDVAMTWNGRRLGV